MPQTISNGWLSDAQIIASPNYDQRPPGTTVDLLVVHNISLPPGQYGRGYIQQLFCNQLDCSLHPYFKNLIDLKVSSHCLIERSGKVIQFVAFDDRAWHAGESVFLGRTRCNDFAIGIELEGTDDDPYTEAQYLALVEITRALMLCYPHITKDRIVGHSDIAPQRKSDPGPTFNWQKFLQSLG